MFCISNVIFLTFRLLLIIKINYRKWKSFAQTVRFWLIELAFFNINQFSIFFKSSSPWKYFSKLYEKVDYKQLFKLITVSINLLLLINWSLFLLFINWSLIIWFIIWFSILIYMKIVILYWAPKVLSLSAIYCNQNNV